MNSKTLGILSLFRRNKETIKLAIPVFIELLLNVGINYVNQFMFAGFPVATNAIGQVNQISNIFIVSFSVLSTSSLILITQLRGSQDENGIKKIYPLTLFLNLIIGIIVALILFLISPFIFNIMQVDPSIIHFAKLYLYITAPSLIFYSINQAYSSFLRANKRMVEPTIISLITNGVNILACVIVLRGINTLTLEQKLIGVGFATLLSRIISCIVSYIFFRVKVKTKISLKELKPFPINFLTKQLKIGLPTAGETLSYNLSQFVLTIIVNASCSVLDQNLRTYIMTFTSIIYLFASGSGIAMQVIEGMALGKENKDEAYKLVIDTGKMARIVSFILSLIVLAIAYPTFMGLMSSAVNDPEINVNGVDTSYCGLTAVLCLSINVILEQGRATNLIYVKGLETAGDIAFPVCSSIVTSWLFTVGVSALLCLVFNLGIYGAFIGAMLDECIRGIGFYIRWKKGSWRKIDLLKGIKKENS